MLALLPSAAARADAIARAGRTLWRADADRLSRSDDEGLSWRTVAPFDEDDAVVIAALAATAERVVAASDQGLVGFSSGHARVLAEGPCDDVRSDGDRMVARCRGHWLASDGGPFMPGGEPRAPLKPPDADHARADGDHTVAWNRQEAWISTDRGRHFASLPDAAAYDLIDAVPDGEGGAFALTDVGVVRLRPDEDRHPTTRTALPRLSLSGRWHSIGGSSETVLLALLDVPLDRASDPTLGRMASRRNVARDRARSAAARLRMASRTALSRGRTLRAEELAAQAAVLVENRP